MCKPRRVARRAVAGVAVAASAMGAAVAQPAPPWHAPAPAPSTVRYDEDWSGLDRPTSSPGRWTEALKNVPVADGRLRLTTGLELRLRSETFRDNLWGKAAAPDDGYLWVRALPYADLRMGSVRAFVQPIAAYAVGARPAPSPIDQTRVDLLQGFGELTLPVGSARLTLRSGRQMMPLGSERLVGSRYGPNVPLAFDGVRADLRTAAGVVSLFDVKPVQPRLGGFDDRVSTTKALWGAYATLPNLDLYYLGYRRRGATFSGRTADEHRDSFGLRTFGSAAPWRWNIEAVAQTGRFDGQTIRAWTVGAEIGRAFADAPLSPQTMVRFNVVSGDRNPHDGRLGTFNALFPKGKYFGELSPIGPYNIVSLNPGVTLDLGTDLSLGLNAMAYWRYATADGVYDVPGDLVRGSGSSKARFIGKQAEAALDWQATPEVELSISISAFAPGAFFRQTGPAQTIRMLGLEANIRF